MYHHRVGKRGKVTSRSWRGKTHLGPDCVRRRSSVDGTRSNRSGSNHRCTGANGMHDAHSASVWRSGVSRCVQRCHAHLFTETKSRHHCDSERLNTNKITKAQISHLRDGGSVDSGEDCLDSGELNGRANFRSSCIHRWNSNDHRSGLARRLIARSSQDGPGNWHFLTLESVREN